MSRQNCRGDAVRAAHFLSKRMYPEVPAVDRWVLHIREYLRHMASIALFPAVVSGSTADTDVPLGVWYSFPVRRRIPFRYHWQTNIAGFPEECLFPFRAAYVQWQISMCMDQVVETECTQDAADSDEEAHEDKEPVMGGDPEDAPKKYTEKADCTDGNQLCENGLA